MCFFQIFQHFPGFFPFFPGFFPVLQNSREFYNSKVARDLIFGGPVTFTVPVRGPYKSTFTTVYIYIVCTVSLLMRTSLINQSKFLSKPLRNNRLRKELH